MAVILQNRGHIVSNPHKNTASHVCSVVDIELGIKRCLYEQSTEEKSTKRPLITCNIPLQVDSQ